MKKLFRSFTRRPLFEVFAEEEDERKWCDLISLARLRTINTFKVLISQQHPIYIHGI